MTKTRAYVHIKYLRQLIREMQEAVNSGNAARVDEIAMEIQGTTCLLQEAFGEEGVL